MPYASRPASPAPGHLVRSHRGAPFPFFIDRGLGDKPSFAGSAPREQLVVDAEGRAQIWRDGAWHDAGHYPIDPLDAIDAFVDGSRSDPVAVPSWLDGVTLPRTVGYLSYELGSRCDRVQAPPAAGKTRIGTPLAVLSVYDDVDAWDPRSGRTWHVRFAHSSPAAPPPALQAPVQSWQPTTRAAYRRGFARILSAIRAGDIYQANLSRRAVFEFDGDAISAYCRLRDVQPVPWGAFLGFGGFSLLSNSPECFLERDGDAIATRPIKGTRARRGEPAADAAERASLASDPKEMAEHLMIVDLERSDLGRVATTGSVRVTRYGAVESFATVHHMASDVEATLRHGIGLAALLRATFPGGSITGAPKLRAMEILAEVEDGERGPYTGAIGCFNGSDRLSLSIAIRTAVTAGNQLLYAAGGGIVADSDAEREWEETEIKIGALRAALAAGGRAGHAPAAAKAL
ncbi:MAG TPA: aminodeoxychorismate synthase component I [Candidatus Binatia bacterium]|jgi:para-aminobenzoate synthetase component 1